jgi:predicted transcriptional regulator
MLFNKNKKELEETKLALEKASIRIKTLESEYESIINKDDHIKELDKTIGNKQQQLNELNDLILELLNEKEKNENVIKIYEDTIEINSFGIVG